MREDSIFKKRIHFDVTDSTNIQAKKGGLMGEESGTVYTAEFQTAGRGTKGRTWLSKKSEGVIMSLLLRPTVTPDKISQITLIAAMAVTEAVNEVLDGTSANGTPDGSHLVKCQIKWPNDVLLNGKKMCGILTEMAMQPDGSYFVVIGIGINVNTTEFDPVLGGMATSMKAETGCTFEKEQVLEGFGRAFARYYKRFVACENLKSVVEDYDRMLVNCGREVRLSEENPNSCFAASTVAGGGQAAGKAQEAVEYFGTALGINENGELLIRMKDGQVKAHRSGEIQVRGIYGYV